MDLEQVLDLNVHLTFSKKKKKYIYIYIYTHLISISSLYIIEIKFLVSTFQYF